MKSILILAFAIATTLAFELAPHSHMGKAYGGYDLKMPIYASYEHNYNYRRPYAAEDHGYYGYYPGYEPTHGIYDGYQGYNGYNNYHNYIPHPYKPMNKYQRYGFPYY